MLKRIEKAGMFKTPKNWDEIFEFIESTNCPNESIIVAMFVWNFAIEVLRDDNDNLKSNSNN